MILGKYPIRFEDICTHPIGRCPMNIIMSKLIRDVVMHWIYIEVWLTAKPFFISPELTQKSPKNLIYQMTLSSYML